MHKLLIVSLALCLSAVFSVAQAGIAPSHDASQLTQSGAKIAAPKKAEDDQEDQKKPTEQAPSSDDKR